MAASVRPELALPRQPVIWAPHDGSQTLFLSCPIGEVLYEGTRGPGKTDALLMDYAQHVGVGYGQHWRGILFRESYPQLADVVAKSKRWFFQIFRGAKYNESNHTWHFPTGEELLLRHMSDPDDYWNYHGHEYPWIAWEELTNWPDLKCYHAMKACSRSSHRGMPRKYRATANPFGVGHNVVKQYFIDVAPPGVIHRDPETGLERVRIHGHWSENTTLLAADPQYPTKLAADPDKQRRKAWHGGSWDVIAGGFFDDLWDRDTHAVRPFPIPHSWRIDRSFDWGSSKPFSVGWWAESDGTRLPNVPQTHVPRGTLFRFAEWYGWNGKPNEGSKMLAVDVAKGILEREKRLGIAGRVNPGPADSSIFDVENGKCIGTDMRAAGVHWLPANKGPGSRKNGWEIVRKLLKASVDRSEDPHLYVFDTCTDGFLRTVPVLPRDKVKTDDVDTKAEDHAADETRYRVLAERTEWRMSHFAV